MTLTTHAIVGAAAASLFPQVPVVAFAAGFASHFVIDAIPHWAEGPALMRSFIRDSRTGDTVDMRLGKDFLHDLAVIAVDALLGLGLSLLIFYIWFFHVPLFIILIGVVAGMLPDPLQFLYFKTTWSFMTPLQNFHKHIQKEIPNVLAIGIEIVLIVLVVVVLKTFM